MSHSQPEILVLPDRAALARLAAARFVSLAQNALRVDAKFSVALSGGSTPRDLYALLATHEFSSRVDWSQTHLFWSDERAVPPDNPDSNFKMANDTLISHVPIPPENVHRIHAEIAPDAAAAEYEAALGQFFSSSRKAGEPRSRVGADRTARSDWTPRFDLILLGLGPDAHTASLFPHTPALRETSHCVTAQYVEKLNTHRITFTPRLINAAGSIFFLVAGVDKADAVRAVLFGKYSPEDFPAQLVQPIQGKLTWLLDQAASSESPSNN